MPNFITNLTNSVRIFCIIPYFAASKCAGLVFKPPISVSKGYGGGVIKVKCPPKYRLSGFPTLMCDGINWSHETPTCQCKQL